MFLHQGPGEGFPAAFGADKEDNYFRGHRLVDSVVPWVMARRKWLMGECQVLVSCDRVCSLTPLINNQSKKGISPAK